MNNPITYQVSAFLTLVKIVMYINSTIVLYSRDHKGLGMAYETHDTKTSLTFP